MAFKKQTSFIDDPDQEDYLNAGTATPKYVAPDPVATPTYLRMDTPAQSPVNPAPDGSVPGASWDDTGTPNKPPTAAELRQQVADLAAQRPEKGKAGIWRTLAAIGAGTAIGYGSRGPQGQENVNNVVGAIMYPGYDRKVNDWATQVSDKTTQAQQAEKIDADAVAANKSAADLDRIKAETRNQNAQAAWRETPDAPKPPAPVTEKVVVVGPDGKNKTETHYFPDPTKPDQYSVLGTPPSVEGGPKTEAEMRRAAYMAAHNGQEPDEATVASWAKPIEPPHDIGYWIRQKNSKSSTPEQVAEARRNLADYTAQTLAGRARPANEPVPLSPRQQAISDKLASGDFNPAQLARFPDKEALISGAIEKNPSWSPQTYATKKAFEDPQSKQSQNLGTISRIVGHIGRFEQNSKELGVSPSFLIGQNLTGKAAATYQDAHAISSELEKLISGGVGTEGQVRQWQKGLTSSNPDIRQQTVDELSQLIGSQYEGMNQTYKATLNSDLPIEKYVSPAGRAWLSAKGINAGGSGGAPAPAQAAHAASGGVGPIALKDGTFLTPHDAKAADDFRRDHPELIK